MPVVLTAIVVAGLFGQPGTAAQEVTRTAVLGIQAGSSLDDARAALRPLGTSDSRRTRDGGTKEVWTLDRTGFAWIALKADASGRIVWLTGHRRKGHEIQFDAIGAPPAVADEAMAVWHTSGPLGPTRIALRGRDRRAQVVTVTVVNP